MNIRSWGRYPPPAPQTLLPLRDRHAPLPDFVGSALPHGNGRSYGDTCLNDHGTMIRMQAGTPGWQLHPALGARPGEPVVEKQHPDSFRGTNLGALLRQLRVQRLVLCGAQSDYCVDTTCRRAASEGFAVVLAADAHSTVGNGVIDAATIIRHENRTLGSFARVADSAALLAEGLGAGSGA